MPADPAPITLYIDADACPVKDEVYRVGRRYGLKTVVVANSFMMVPTSPLIARVVVEAGPDAADDWIAEQARAGDVIVTSDIPLAGRALKTGAAALAPNGRPFTEDSIGAALSQRALMEHLRSTGEATGGPRPFDRNDRARFLQVLDETINRELRRRRR